MKKTLSILFLFTCMAWPLQAQVYNQMDEYGNVTQRDEYGSHSNFNPNKRDSVKGVIEVPVGVKLWTVDRRFGDSRPAEIDTLHHLFQNTIYNTGVFGEYNTTGSNFTPRQSRIFTNRSGLREFFFTEPFSFTTVEPDQFLFVNTLSPYTRINYDECGNKQHGEDHIDAKFAVNAGKRLGFGFDLDYHYSLGYFSNQNNANFRSSIFTSYLGDKYQMSLVGSLYHRKNTESGGIFNDEYITHPESLDEQFSEEEIPTVLSQNWHRNDSRHLFLSHRYNIGFYRLVPMTEEEIKAREFAEKSAKEREEKEQENSKKSKTGGRPDGAPIGKPMGRPDNARIAGDEPEQKKPSFEDSPNRIKVDSKAKQDSLSAAQALEDSIASTMKKEFVPVTSFIHTVDINSHDRIYQANVTPSKSYYAKTYYDLNDENEFSGDSIYDKTKFLSIKNTVALALLEGFNKYMKAGMKVFASYDFRKYKMPDLTANDSTRYFMNKWTEYDLSIGGQISKTQGNTLHFNLAAEYGVTGANNGGLGIDFSTDLNFPLLGDTVQLAAMASFHRMAPVFFLNHYHSKHLWWDQSLEKETRTHIEGLFSYPKTNTRLRIAVDQLNNYTYFGMSYALDQELNRRMMTGSVYQASSGINVLMAQLYQNFRLGIINWENVVTYQNSSNQEVLPLPQLNLFSNLFLKFKIARVLNVELGGSVTYFTKYEAPDYLPLIGQFAIQQNESSRVELGGYPFVDVYVNFQLKRTRFFLSMNHVNADSGTRMQFLAPHYPVNSRVLHFGLSWNFYN